NRLGGLALSDPPEANGHADATAGELPRPSAPPQAVGPEPLLVDLVTLCHLLGVSYRTGKRMVADRAIPGIVRPYGRAVRFELAAVRRWIEKGCPRQTGPRRRAR